MLSKVVDIDVERNRAGLDILYEVAILIWFVWWHEKSMPMPRAWIYANAVIEAVAPTSLGLLVTIGDRMALQAAAVGPVSHLYAIRIVLSIYTFLSWLR